MEVGESLPLPNSVLLRSVFTLLFCRAVDTAVLQSPFEDTSVVGERKEGRWVCGPMAEALGPSFFHPCSHHFRKAAGLVCLFSFLIMLHEACFFFKKGCQC